MSYLFDPEELHRCSQLGLDQPLEQAFDTVTSALAARYPGHIREGRRRWIFNNAGGAMGQLCLLHASLNEYILFFGSAIGTEGHSGRYWAEVHDFMMAGDMWCYVQGETEKTIYRPGDAAYLRADQVKGYRLPDAAWMLEYARGPIPTMLPFGLADSLLSTLDWINVGATILDYGRLTVRSLLQRPNCCANP